MRSLREECLNLDQPYKNSKIIWSLEGENVFCLIFTNHYYMV